MQTFNCFIALQFFSEIIFNAKIDDVLFETSYIIKTVNKKKNKQSNNELKNVRNTYDE